jgi:hypothetical protein
VQGQMGAVLFDGAHRPEHRAALPLRRGLHRRPGQPLQVPFRDGGYRGRDGCQGGPRR